MDQFNLRAEDDVKLFRENNGAKRHRSNLIIGEGQEIMFKVLRALSRVQ